MSIAGRYWKTNVGSTLREIGFATAYMAAHLIESTAGRPGCLQWLEWPDIESVQRHNDLYVLLVPIHKTAQMEPAVIVMNEDQHQMFQHYVKCVRPAIDPATEEFQNRVFLSANGNDFTNISQKIWCALGWGTAIHERVKFSATKLRKVIETMVYNCAGEKLCEEVDAMLNHSPSVGRQCYYVPDLVRKAVHRYNIIRQITGDISV